MALSEREELELLELEEREALAEQSLRDVMPPKARMGQAAQRVTGKAPAWTESAWPVAGASTVGSVAGFALPPHLRAGLAGLTGGAARGAQYLGKPGLYRGEIPAGEVAADIGKTAAAQAGLELAAPYVLRGAGAVGRGIYRTGAKTLGGISEQALKALKASPKKVMQAAKAGAVEAVDVTSGASFKKPLAVQTAVEWGKKAADTIEGFIEKELEKYKNTVRLALGASGTMDVLNSVATKWGAIRKTIATKEGREIFDHFANLATDKSYGEPVKRIVTSAVKSKIVNSATGLPFTQTVAKEITENPGLANASAKNLYEFQRTLNAAIRKMRDHPSGAGSYLIQMRDALLDASEEVGGDLMRSANVGLRDAYKFYNQLRPIVRADSALNAIKSAMGRGGKLGDAIEKAKAIMPAFKNAISEMEANLAGAEFAPWTAGLVRTGLTGALGAGAAGMLPGAGQKSPARMAMGAAMLPFLSPRLIGYGGLAASQLARPLVQKGANILFGAPTRAGLEEVLR